MSSNQRMDPAKVVKVKDGVKTFLKRFGPLLLTGLAAVAEHHWFDHKDDSGEGTRARDRSGERDDRNPIRKLECEVSDLKRSLSRKAREDEGGRDAGPAPRIREEIVREWRPPYQEDQSRERRVRGRALVDERTGPSSSQPRERHVRGRELPNEGAGPSSHHPYPVLLQVQTPRQTARREQFEQVREREYTLPSHRQHSIQRRHRRHRHSSVPHRSSYEAAALAGAVEAIHVADIKGDWVGPKGVRVGTTMAASYAASRSRDRDPDKSRKWQAAVDVGTGLLVSELVHGSAKKLEENETLMKKGRRWSYCY